MSNVISVEEINACVVVRFDRPEVRSPLSVDVLDQLSTIVAGTARRTGIRRLIFTGVGNVFASGADLREIATLGATTAGDFARRGQKLMQEIYDLEIETTAAVNGVCFGGALDLALACKRRIAGPDAIFAHPGANLGIMTGWGGTQRLPRLVGQAKALEMFFTTRRVGADEALSIGLIDAIDDDPLALASN